MSNDQNSKDRVREARTRRRLEIVVEIATRRPITSDPMLRCAELEANLDAIEAIVRNELEVPF